MVRPLGLPPEDPRAERLGLLIRSLQRGDVHLPLVDREPEEEAFLHAAFGVCDDQHRARVVGGNVAVNIPSHDPLDGERAVLQAVLLEVARVDELAKFGCLLVAESFGANGVNTLPTPDVTGTIAMSATAAKVALVNTTTALTGACPTGATIVDLIGYGTTPNCFETALAPAPSTTTADVRGTNGCTETDNNSTDFTATTPNPRNTSVALAPCGGGL